MAYCSEADLLLTAEVLVAPTEKTRFINLASDAMDAKLGYLYVVPIDISDGSNLPNHQILLLKTINAKLATGRLIMASAQGQQNSEVNAYAAYLIREAETDLASIANGQVDLLAPRVGVEGEGVGNVDDPSVADPFARIPGSWNPDQVSPVTVFEKNYMTPESEPMFFTPGGNIIGDGSSTRYR